MAVIPSHEDIVKRCLELDARAKEKDFSFYFLTCNQLTFQLACHAMTWRTLSENERYCLVKYGNFFLSSEEAEQARQRALNY